MRRFFAAAAVLWLMTAPAWAVSFPPLSGRVVDNAHMLSPATITSLETQLAAQEQATGTQLVVVTLPSLQGLTIEDYGYQLGRHWGIGQQGKNNGAMLIVVPGQHKLRIEVGYGLEGVLTDAVCSQIIQTIIVPEFKRGAMEKGVVDGVQAMEAVLSGEPADSARAQLTRSISTHTSGHVGIVAIVIGLILFSQVALFLFYVLGSILAAFLSLFGLTGFADYMRRAKAKIYPADRLFLLWLLTPSFRIGGSRGGSDSGFSGGGGSFGGGGSSGSW